MSQKRLIKNDNYLDSGYKVRFSIFVIVTSLIAILAYVIMKYFGSPISNTPLFFVIIIGGIPLLFRILLMLIKGNLGADLLAGISIITAIILGEYLAATLVILMIASGITLELYGTRKASSALVSLLERMPTKAHCKKGEQVDDVELSDIQIGDIIIIYPHEACPVDGVVIDGRGAMDESYLTGEPYIISKTIGSQVLSGAINGEYALTIKATKLASDSRYSSIVKVLQESEGKRPTLKRLGDQIGAIFAPMALFAALLTWYISGEAIRFLAVLVIATPCPLLIAIPITIISAISLAAKRGIIIKDPTVLEKLSTCRTAIFDKTGTLTYGKPILTDIITVDGIDSNFILQQVASLERYSKHPLSQAILTSAKEKDLGLLCVKEISEKAGQGLSGVIDSHQIHVTSRKNALKNNFDLNEKLPQVMGGLECIIFYDNTYVATFRFRDLPRKESKKFISHLKPFHCFSKVMLVSGDRESEVKYFGDLLKTDEIYASQTPEQKFKIVCAERSNAATLFMGDGINDAPALAAATVGIAFGQFGDVTAEAAGAVIMENEINKVDELLHLSINTRKIALQSAVGGMMLSIIGMGFAAFGYINPVTGAILQELIDVFAIINSLRLVWGQNITIDIPNVNI